MKPTRGISKEDPSLFLPITREEMARRGWDAVDIVLVTGDAYVDHPAFGTAVIGRVLEAAGYRVGIIAMPDWRDPGCMTVFGRPRLFFGVTSGNVDSMIANYTAFRRRRRGDPYTPGGKGRRPNRAILVYANLIRQVYRDVPLVFGGIEASMRRLAHYDFWDDRVRRSVLRDGRAEVVIYGMAETAVVEVARRIAHGQALDGIPNTVIDRPESPPEALILPEEEEVLVSSKAFLTFYRLLYRNLHRRLAQKSGGRWLVHEPPDPAFDTAVLDRIYALPFTRRPHPLYEAPIPAYEMIRGSVTAHRGCVSGCSFCTLALHQGRRIISRSPGSILEEIRRIASEPDFPGHVTDIGGPTANMYGISCNRGWRCGRESCLFPELCPSLRFSNAAWIDLLERAARVPGVKRVTVGSGLRYDLFMRDLAHRDQLFRLARNHISGQLKIAPEHTDPEVLRAMRKRPLVPLEDFLRVFQVTHLRLKKRQYLLPYLMSNHPGSTPEKMETLQRDILRGFRIIPEQVQAFIPLPMTLSSVQYYTGEDPLTGEHFTVARSDRDRRKQHALCFGSRPRRSFSLKGDRQRCTLPRYGCG